MSTSELYPFQLVDVRLFEATIERLKLEESSDKDQEPEIHLAIQKNIRKHEEKNFVSVFLSLNILGPKEEVPEFRIYFTLEGLFDSIDDLDKVKPDIWEDFENTSSISLMWPYIREHLHNFVTRMRVTLPILPTLNRLSITGEKGSSVSP